MKRTKMQKGITLIALIITIIILLILAVVTIGSIKDSNIITYAQKASTEYEAKKDEEESIIFEYEDFIGVNIQATTIEEAQLEDMFNKKVNSVVKDIYNNKIVIPAGFKILVDQTTVYTSDNIDVTKGIVIQDKEGNEFVWIPVGENITNATKKTTIKLSRYLFDKTTGKEIDIGENFRDGYEKELATSTYGNATAKNLPGFLDSVARNNGYYIARHEAGVTGYDPSKTDTSYNNSGTGYIAEEGKELKLVSKINQQVWNYIKQNKASEVCRNMYDENRNFTSDLVNSYAWDTALVFIQTFGTEIDASTYSIKAASTKKDTNRDKYCNIYNMSENYFEWTTETFVSSSNPGVFRGGGYHTRYYCCGDKRTASCCGAYNTNFSSVYDSFRPIIYIGN